MPPLAEDDVAVAEIVQRVKCEIWAAAPQPSGKYPTGPYQWMKDWTAKIDLTLTTNDMGNVSPAASFVTPMTPQTLPGIGAFTRSFTFGVGGGVNTSASRTETMSFTLSFAELRNDWYRGLCAPADGLGLLGNLGLKEWMQAALAPVRGPHPELTWGYHTASSSAKAAAPTPTSTQKQIADLVADPIGRKIAQIDATLDSLQAYADEAKAYGNSAKKVAARLKVDDLTKSPADFASEVQRAADFISQAQDAVDQVGNETSKVNQQLDQLKKLPGAPADPRVAKEVSAAATITATAQTTISGVPDALKAAIANLPTGGPIDSIAHQVSFIVTWSLNASPSWTLVHFHGPETGSSLVSVSRGFTHTLNIAMGSPSNNGLSQAGAEQLRQLDYLRTQGAFVNAIQQAPAGGGF